MHRDTRILHAGYNTSATAGVPLPGPQFSSTYTTPGEPSQHSLTYGRFHNPTWTRWEDALGILEGGHVVAYASGMAAVAAVFGVFLKPGETLVLPSDSYYTTRVFAARWLNTIGVRTRLVPTREVPRASAIDGARLLWLESPSNPQLDVCDIAEWVRLARQQNVLVAVDNTTSTAYLQQPLELGAHLVVASDTKALTGHSDLVLGHVATRDQEQVNGAAHLADGTWVDSGAHGSVARPSLARDGGRPPETAVCLRRTAGRISCLPAVR